MSLKYKPDWEETKKRYVAWWNGEYIGRALLTVHAPKADPPSLTRPTPPANPEQRWIDRDYLIAFVNYWLDTSYFGGDSYPMWHAGYPGHVSIPAFVGCPVSFQEDTVWWDPIIDDDSLDVRRFTIDPDNRWWKYGIDLQHLAVREAQGRCIPGIVAAFGGCGDTLAAYRGSEKLLLDCIERPDAVREAEMVLMEQWKTIYDTFYTIARDAAEGSSTWFGLWAPGKSYATHCDFSFNISPKMFRDLFLPALEMQVNYLDYPIYHLDGTGAFGHLPAIMELEKLRVVQVLPGAGQPSPIHFLDVCKEVQAGGKNLHISIPAHEVPQALSLLSAKGLCIDTWVRTEQEAKDLVTFVERESKI